MPAQSVSVRWGPPLEELALPPLRLQQHDLAVGQLVRKRDPGRSAAGADVDDRPVETPDEVERAKRVVEQHAPRFVEVAQRGQARCRDDRCEPPLKRG
jgi:hypothetical protein